MKGNQLAWRRLAEAVLFLPLLAGPLGCQTAGGGQRIRMPILTGPDIAGPLRAATVGAATVRERSSLPLPYGRGSERHGGRKPLPYGRGSDKQCAGRRGSRL